MYRVHNSCPLSSSSWLNKSQPSRAVVVVVVEANDVTATRLAGQTPQEISAVVLRHHPNNRMDNNNMGSSASSSSTSRAIRAHYNLITLTGPSHPSSSNADRCL